MMKTIGKIKFFITRSMGYLAIMNTFMLLYLTLNEMDISNKFLPLIIVVALGLSILFGYVEMKLKIISADVELATLNNPIIMEMKNNIKILLERSK